MDRDDFLRRALWTTVVFNLGGATLFAFPSSPFGQLAGLPQSVPLIYRAFLALFVLLFAGAYAWLARQPTIDRPLVALGAIGKAGAFAVVFVLWVVGEVPGIGVLGFVGDLIFAGIFTWWLLGSRQGASSRAFGESK